MAPLPVYRPEALPEPADVLRAIADLAPGPARLPLDVTRAYGPFAWLGAQRPAWLRGTPGPSTMRVRTTPELRRLAALDALHRDERLLRVGWVFLAGRTEVDGEDRDVCLPVLSRPVRLSRLLGASTLTPAGDAELVDLAATSPDASRLETAALDGDALHEDSTSAEQAALQTWIRQVAEAAGLHVDDIVPAEDPRQWRGRDGLVAVVGMGVYAARDVAATDMRATLRAWPLRRSTPSPLDAASSSPRSHCMPLRCSPTCSHDRAARSRCCSEARSGVRPSPRDWLPGMQVRAGYPVGRWTVDLCVGEGSAALAVACEVHPDGAAAHVDRQRALRRAGWTVVETFPSGHQEDPVRAALALRNHA